MTSDPSTASSRADRYLSVDLERVTQTRRDRLRSGAFATFMNFVVIWPGGMVEPKDPANVIVTRRSDGVAVATFEHEYLFEAARHRDSIRDRLSTEQIFDLCRELQIDIGQVGTPQDG
jgi:hypothetical protein